MRGHKGSADGQGTLSNQLSQMPKSFAANRSLPNHFSPSFGCSMHIGIQEGKSFPRWREGAQLNAHQWTIG